MQTLDEAPELQKRTLPFHVARNWTLIATGNVNEVRKKVDLMLSVVKTTELLLQDAILKVASRDWAGARASLEPVLKATPEDTRALSLLAQTYSAQNQRPAATDRIRQLAAQRPRSLALQMFWAQWLLENNQKVEAREALAAAKAADQKNPDPLLLLAGLDFTEGRLNEARAILAALLSLDQRNPEGVMLMAQVEEASNNHAKAMEHYRKLLTLDSRHARALNNLAFLLSRDQTKLDEAMSLAQKAKELAPESPQVQDTLGWIYYRKGLYTMAVNELERALAKVERPMIQFHLGMTYNRLGNTTKGGRLVAAALAKDPKLADTEIP